MSASATVIYALPTAPLRWALRATLLAASADPTRPALCGVRVVPTPTDPPAALDYRPGQMLWVATDGHRLHIATIYVPEAARPARLPPATLDRWGLADVLKALPKGKAAPAEVTIEATPSGWAFSWGGTRLAVSAVMERYPDWPQVIPAPLAEGAPGTPRWGVDPSYLADACVAAPNPRHALTCVQPADALSPWILSAQDPDLGRLTVIVMPKRI